MKISQYFIDGGLVFMVSITITGLMMLYFSIQKVLRMVKKSEFDLLQLNYILLFGSLSLLIGILDQARGFYIAMESIGIAGGISTSLFATGFQLSLIAPIYGLIIFLFSLIIWAVLKEINLKKIQ